MKRWWCVGVLLVVACSSQSHRAPNPTSDRDVKLEDLLSESAVGVTRETPDAFAILGAVRDLLDQSQPCWKKLTGHLVAGYQVSLPKGAYFVAEGDLPRADVEACLPQAVKLPIEKARDVGDLVAFGTPNGTVYAAWRGQFLLFGSHDEVAAAVVRSAETAARWRPLLASVAGTPSYVLRIDNTIAPLVGESVVSYALVIDKVEPPPRSVFAGRFIVHYADAAAAAKGAALVTAWSTSGRWPFPIDGPASAVELYDRLAAAIGTMTRTQTGSELVIAFDSNKLGGPEAMSSLFQTMEHVYGELQAHPARK